MAKGKLSLNQALKEMTRDKPDLKKVFGLLEKSAQQNNHEALYALGTWYLHGRFVKKNIFLAVKYFTKSIEGDNRNAYYDLALCYEKGEGVKKNYKKAFAFYLKAALLGDDQSLYEVGRCFYYGIGISRNQNIGSIWIKHAKRKGVK